MKSLGIVRKIDELGRIVIPKEFRKINDWNEGDPLEMFSDRNALVLKKYEPSNTKEKKEQALRAVNSLKERIEKGMPIEQKSLGLALDDIQAALEAE